MYLANKLVDNHIKTFITYNKGQTWALLPAPATDVAGNSLHCVLVSLSLHAAVNERASLIPNDANDVYHSDVLACGLDEVRGQLQHQFVFLDS